MPESKQCDNCATTLTENARFCPQCGQPTGSLNRPFLGFAKDAMHELLDIDGRFALTLRTLFLRPGLASYEFTQGKRAKYTPSLRLYLVTSLLFFLVFSSFQNVYTGESQHSGSTTELYSRAMFILFPLFALYVKCFFQSAYYLSCLVFSMHLHSVGYAVLMVVGPLEAMETRSDVFVYLQLLPTCYFAWYLLKAFKTMFRQSWPLTLLKAFGVYFIYMGTLGVVFDAVLG